MPTKSHLIALSTLNEFLLKKHMARQAKDSETLK